MGCCVAGVSNSFAQQTKGLVVRKIKTSTCVVAKAVSALLDKNQVNFQLIDQVNWEEYPYKPEVKFRIAHTGKEILLHYKVVEQSVRAMAEGDNGRVWEDACVEFFVSPEGDSCYYNFECNCTGKLLIQGGPLGNRSLAEKDVLNMVKRWSSLGNGSFEEQVGELNWELTLVIPAKAFFRHELAVLDGCIMKGNFYKCGDKLLSPHFLSWTPITLSRPQFHCPQYFGELVFE